MKAKEKKMLVQVLVRIECLKKRYSDGSKLAEECGNPTYTSHYALVASAYENCYGLLSKALTAIKEKKDA